MVRLISRQRGSLAALKLTKLFGIDDFLAAKDSGKVLIIIYCYLIIIKSDVWLFHCSKTAIGRRYQISSCYKMRPEKLTIINNHSAVYR